MEKAITHNLTRNIPARSIGDRIRLARKRKALNQADLARRIGVSQPAIANWETGVHDPRRIMLARLADALEAPLDWLAAGDRSALERDTHAAAAYIRRDVQHVPVVSMRSAILLSQDFNADPHDFAEDYIPVTTNARNLFAVFVSDEAINAAIPQESLVVIDYGDRAPSDGGYCAALVDGQPTVRRWRSEPAQFEPASLDAGHKIIAYTDNTPIIGCVRVSIKIL